MMDVIFFKDHTVGKKQEGTEVNYIWEICEKAITGVLTENAHGLV